MGPLNPTSDPSTLAVVPDPPAPSAPRPAREVLADVRGSVTAALEHAAIVEAQLADLRFTAAEVACRLDAAVAGEPLEARELRDLLRAALRASA